MILQINTHTPKQRQEFLERVSNDMSVHIMYRRDLHDDIINVLRALIAENERLSKSVTNLMQGMADLENRLTEHHHPPPLSTMVFS